MRLPETWIERLPFLDGLNQEWEPVRPSIAIVAGLFYFAFLYQEARGTGLLLTMDVVFVPIHEGGHLLFRFFGEFISVAGGTALQLGVPLALCIYFAFQRKVQGVAFCAFFSSSNFCPFPSTWPMPAHKNCRCSRWATPATSSTIGTIFSVAWVCSTTTFKSRT